MDDPTSGSYLSLALAALIIGSILLNYRKNRTPVALVLTGIGALCLFLSEWITGSPFSYYLGTGLLFFGVWYNGSYFYFYKRVKDKFLDLNMWSRKADQIGNI